MKIGDNVIIHELGLARHKKGLTMKVVADRIGCSVSSLAGWENRRNSPSLDSVMRWAIVLGYELELTKLVRP